MTSNIIRNVDILTTSLNISIEHNYFDNLLKLFLDLYLAFYNWQNRFRANVSNVRLQDWQSLIKMGDEYKKKKMFDRRHSGRHGTTERGIGEC